MRSRIRLILAASLSAIAVAASPLHAAPPPQGPVLVVHGGAGVTRASITADEERQARAALERALRAGHALLAAGKPALDAVTAAIAVLEDDPHFNAGKGAVFTHDGHNELDAAVMDGATRKAGAVAGVRTVRNPILLARAVMERSPHVMMVGQGAEAFAAEQGIERVDPRYFRTEKRWKQLQDALKAEADTSGSNKAEAGKAEADKAEATEAGSKGAEANEGQPRPSPARTASAPSDPRPGLAYTGTVGALALDARGELAAGTSTGGMTNKRYGRVGDAPIIGAGTWADDRCAVSGTGWGEFYIRTAAAHEICARMAYLNEDAAKAGDTVINGAIPALGGDGGAIVLSAQGQVGLPFNTEGMYRGWIGADGVPHVAVFAGEKLPLPDPASAGR